MKRRERRLLLIMVLIVAFAVGYWTRLLTTPKVIIGVRCENRNTVQVL